MAVLWAAVVIAGIAVAATASRRGVELATAVAAAWGAPPLAIGVSLLAIGTDVPEVANSIVSSLSGHGDVNVGDSIGSAATQGTLVLGLVPFLAVPVVVGARRVLTVGTVTVLALVVGAALVSDGHLSRLDGSTLLVLWVGGTLLAFRAAPHPEQARLPLAAARPWRQAATAFGWLLVVAVGASAAVAGLVQLSAALGIPEYLVSFTALALGTSLPELLVVITAVRRGQPDLAIGDALGACLVDATLSIGIGPVIAPVAVTSGVAVRGGLGAAAALTLAVALLAVTPRLNRLVGAVLVLLYLAVVAVVLVELG